MRQNIKEVEIQTALNNAMAIGPTLAKILWKGIDVMYYYMSYSEEKGNNLNWAQISGFLGQQNIKQQRPVPQLSHGTRCLPCFLPGDDSPEARGFVESNYLRGLNPSEAFFHACAGREGVIATAMKTSENGYIQKKIGQKIGDAKVWIDGSVRDANGKIISFMYGDDGMDAKKLVSVRGLNAPFFINPISVARQLNSEAKIKKLVLPEDKPRKLSDKEINLLMQYIVFNKIDSPVIKLTTNNAKATLRKIIVDVEIYELKIPELFVYIRDAYTHSKAPYGLMCGLIATSSIGEPTMQMTLNTFHSAGIKNASSGVPRFKQLIGVTKSNEKSKNGCVIYFDHPIIIANAKKITTLSAQNNTDEITEIKNESLKIVEAMKNNFEETFLREFVIDNEMKYLPEDVIDINDECEDNNDECPSEGFLNASPTGLLTYEEYEEEWWVPFSNKLFGDISVTPSHWVILLHFDVEKLYRHRIDLDDIAEILENKSGNNLTCVSSPTIIGRMEVYMNNDDLNSYACSKLGSSTEENSFINDANINYFLCRDVVIDYIKNTQITGISNITKVYPRENPQTHEYIMDTDGVNFLDILTTKYVDSTRTVCDDVHAIKNILGLEASRRAIYEDMHKVISTDTYVNGRHLQVLVDAITLNGNLTAASRDGISREDVGPNAKIMFEKSIDNAATASAFTELDNMNTLASAVMFGKLAKAGSGTVCIRDSDKVPVLPPKPKANMKIVYKNVSTITKGDSKRCESKIT
jgi:hypothetical protein